MSSRSRSRSRSPGYKKSYRRNIRDDSMSPIRTASGANLRTGKPGDNRGPPVYRGVKDLSRNQYNNNYNYHQRGYHNYNRGYYNQRNNYGNRWNRGRGNYRGQWNRNNNWNHQGRNRYNSRSEYDRSRSRSRSRSYDRHRSRSRSYSRSRSRSHSRDISRSPSDERRYRRSRSRSYKRSGRRSRSMSRSRSKSKTPPRENIKQEKEPVKDVLEHSPEPPPPGDESAEIGQQVQKPITGGQQSISRSRWETPDPSPDRTVITKSEQSTIQDKLQQDDIFDKWDDDKLRAYLLKTNAKKLGKDAKKLMEESQQIPVQQVQPKKKKKKSMGDSPTKETQATRGRKKKKALIRTSRTSSGSSSSSSSWSPIHKAPEVSRNQNADSEKSKKHQQAIAPSQQGFEAPPQTYSQQQMYSTSVERMQAVQYPFSHIRKATAPTPVAPPATKGVAQQYQPIPTPTNPPLAQPVPTALPSLGEMHILGPDGKPVKLVQVSVPGPDGKLIQVMQIQPTAAVPTPVAAPITMVAAQPTTAVSQPPITAAPVASSTLAPVMKPSAPIPVNQNKSVYRQPPPPPAYPPPVTQAAVSKYLAPATTSIGNATTPVSNPSNNYLRQPLHPNPATSQNPGKLTFQQENKQGSLPPHVKVIPMIEDELYSISEPSESQNKVAIMEKQKRRQDVLRTRFKPRPASSTWVQERKEETKKEPDVKAQSWMQLNKNEHKQGVSHGFDYQEYSDKKYLKSESDKTKCNVSRSNEVSTSERNIKQSSPVQVSQSQPIQHITAMTPDSVLPVSDVQSIGSVVAQSIITPSANGKPREGHASIPPQLAAQGFKPVYGNPQFLVGPNGEMLQLISGPSAATQPGPSVASVTELPVARGQGDVSQKKPDGWTAAAEEFIRGKPEIPMTRQDDSSSLEDEEDKPSRKKRTISGGSEKKLKKKPRNRRSISSGEDEDPDDAGITTKRKKDGKKKKKKNKKKKEESDEEDMTPAKEKKKKKKQKDKIEDSVENETLKTKKESKGFNEAKKKSKPDNLTRSIAEDLPLSHIRAIVPRRKGEGSQVLLGHISFKSTFAAATSYEERFVSLFGSGETETPQATEQRIDLTKKSVRKFKVNVQGTRSVGHMTQISLSKRIQLLVEDVESAPTPQKVSLNISSLSKSGRHKVKSPSKSRSSSNSSQSGDRSRHYKSKSKSRSISLPLAYSVDDKQNKREMSSSQRYRDRSHSGEQSNEDLRDTITRKKEYGSRSRSRSWSSNEDRDRERNRGQQYQQQRQPYYNRNNQQYYNYNQRGRGQYNNRGYYNNNYRGRSRGYNNYQNRGNFRGRYNNWNQQGYNNRNQNYRYQKYDNRDDHHNRSSDRYDDRDHSPDRTRDRDNRSLSRDKDQKDDKYYDRSPRDDKKEQDEFPFKQKVDEVEPPQNDGNDGNKVYVAGGQNKRKPSPAQWTHDMFEKHEMDGGGQKEVKEEQ